MYQNAKYSNNPGISIIAFPVGKAFIVPLSNLINILYAISNNVYIITGSGGIIKATPHNIKNNIPETYRNNVRYFYSRIIRYINLQIKISFYLMQLSNKIGFCFFFMEDGALLPIITARLLQKKVIWMLPSNISEKINTHKDFISLVAKCLRKTSRNFANQLIVYSPLLIKEWNLEKYRDKIIIAHEHFLDLNSFIIKKQIKQRDVLVSYIGRFNIEKGVFNFIESIPDIIKSIKRVNFLIAGEGPLRNEIEQYLREKDLSGYVEMVGWIPHDDLSNYLNNIKLLVLPSFTEGLPNIMLEAMACGTPLLVAPVGAIPDFIHDGETGFILEDNSPKCITKNIIRALNYPGLQNISNNERLLIENNFTFKRAVENYEVLFI